MSCFYVTENEDDVDITGVAPGTTLEIPLEDYYMQETAISSYFTFVVLANGEVAFQTLESTSGTPAQLLYEIIPFSHTGSGSNYLYTDSCAVNFININGSNPLMAAGDDDETAPYALPFDFTYFGVLYPAGLSFLSLH